jgi:prepilin-type N-terminal cleavage/methylation domain-containing protein
MRRIRPTRHRVPTAFTLVELLVVIAIIGVIASLVIAGAGASSTKKMQKQTAAFMAKLELAIEGFKGTYGTYPPTDPNASDHRVNTLFYELTGTHYLPDTGTPANSVYRSVFDARHALTSGQIQSIFGNRVAGIVNNHPAGTNPSPFLTLDSDSEYYRTSGGVYLLQVPAKKPTTLADPAVSNDGLNFWYYRAYPANGYNPTSYDLWAVIPGKGKDTNVVGNWKR